MKKKAGHPKHGDNSKYIHIRLKSPTLFTKGKFRTIAIGDGLKQVYGSEKGKKKWMAQNMMIPKNKVVQHGDGISIRSAKIKLRLKEHGIMMNRIKQMKTGGSADYTLSGR